MKKYCILLNGEEVIAGLSLAEATKLVNQQRDEYPEDEVEMEE